MPRNIEIKARVPDAESLEASVTRLATDGPYLLRQVDCFYAIAEGRLKLRRFADGHAELIYYRRADSTGPAASEYTKVAVADPDGLGALLSDALGVRGVVKKTRKLFWIDRVRVHLDQVDGLGNFMELEVTLSAGDTEAQGEAIAFALMEQLGIARTDLVDCAYLDLLLVRQRATSAADF